MKPTLADVALQAGVSRSTAGLVLSGRDRQLRISASTAARVRAAAEALGWRASWSARALHSGRSDTVGVIFLPGEGNAFVHAYWSFLAQGVHAAVRASGRDMLLIGDEVSNAFQAGLDMLDAGRIDALVALSYASTGPVLTPGPEPRPVALVNSPHPLPWPVVNLDPGPGLGAALRHLQSLGHRRVTCMVPQGRLHDRWLATQGMCANLGLDLDPLPVPWLVPDLDAAAEIAGWRSVFMPLLDRICTATAVLAVHDRAALALLGLLHERGLRIPRDLSLIGFDDLYAGLATPALTTISHRLPDMGRRAVERALAVLERQGPDWNAEERLPATLVLRDSTAPPHGHG